MPVNAGQTRWLQFGLTLPATGPRFYTAVREAANEALGSGLATEFFFMHKPPGIRLRFRAADGFRLVAAAELDGYLRERLARWKRQGIVTDWRPGVYEPEEHLFGGPVSMRSVHQVFTADSLAWLGYHSAADDHPGPAWAMSLLMMRALLDALRITGWEDLDVWDRLRRQTGRRLGMDGPRSLGQLGTLLQSAWSSPDSLSEGLSDPVRQFAAKYREAVLDEGKRWLEDYFEGGFASVGPREVAAFVIVFHWNRGRFAWARQVVLTEALLSRRPGSDQ
jgi:thiopeptide-type bacteriocin biosynthesis protein